MAIHGECESLVINRQRELNQRERHVSLLKIAMGDTSEQVSTALALRLSWRLWCHAVAMLQRQDMLEEMREVYTETLVDSQNQICTLDVGRECEAAMRARDEALRELELERRLGIDARVERDAAVRDCNLYREQLADLERELEQYRAYKPVVRGHQNGDHHRMCASKWMAHLKSRCAAVSDRLLLEENPVIH